MNNFPVGRNVDEALRTLQVREQPSSDGLVMHCQSERALVLSFAPCLHLTG